MGLLNNLQGLQRRVLTHSGGCHSCPRKRVDFVPSTLRQTQVIFVGEAPGGTEVEKGEGFVGKGGQLLRRVAADSGGITDFSVTNVIHCRPPDNATPEPKEVSCCMAQLTMDEVRGYPVVVLCGAVALRAFFPKTDLDRMRGNVAYHPDFPGQRFYAIWHPAYILRRPNMEADFARLMERLGRIVRGEPAPEWTILNPLSEGFWEALDVALAKPLISLDLETNLLESWLPSSRIKSLALSADAKTVCFASREDKGAWPRVLALVRAYLEKPEKHVVGMNLGFDLVWTEDELGFRVAAAGKHDVALIYHEAKQYKMPSLKELVSAELDGYRYLVHEPHLERDQVLLGLYNAEDVIYALQLFWKGLPLLAPDTRDLTVRVLGPTNYLLRRVERNGLYLRNDYRKQKVDELTAKRREVVLAWKAEDPSFIPETHESGKGLADYLFRIRGLRVISETETTHEPQVDKAAIKQWVREGATYLNHLLKVKEIDKQLSTYVSGFEKHIGPDGRLHSSYTLGYTDSGRPSSRNPNLQNIPRVQEIRDMFGAAGNGILLESDLSQIEFRIMICLSKDETGLAGYLAGLDAHSMTALALAGPGFTKEHRSQAKPVNFALLYGGDWWTVQRYAQDVYGLDWDEATCQRFVDVFFKTYVRMRPFHDKCNADLDANRGWFKSVTGHVFRYADWDSPDKGKRDHAHRSALNSQAQGPAAQICFLIMIHADRLLRERGLGNVLTVNTVYDSIMTEIPDPRNLMDVVATMDEARGLAYEWVKPWFPIPMGMDHKAGPSWGSMEDVKLV